MSLQYTERISNTQGPGAPHTAATLSILVRLSPKYQHMDDYSIYDKHFAFAFLIIGFIDSFF